MALRLIPNKAIILSIPNKLLFGAKRRIEAESKVYDQFCLTRKVWVHFKHCR
jgi:hypothetical protein